MMQGYHNLAKSMLRYGAIVDFSSRFKSIQSQNNPLNSSMRLLLAHFTALSRRMSDDQMSLLASDKIKIDSCELNKRRVLLGA